MRRIRWDGCRALQRTASMSMRRNQGAIFRSRSADERRLPSAQCSTPPHHSSLCLYASVPCMPCALDHAWLWTGPAVTL